MPTVVLLQGVSGSGKSTVAKRLVDEARSQGRTAVVVSADHYFEKDGEYKFDGRYLEAAHATCFKRFQEALASRVDLVVVDNTATKLERLTPYVLATSAANLDLEVKYEVKVLRIRCDVRVAAERNVHRVPERKIREMAADIAACRFPFHWKWETVG